MTLFEGLSEKPYAGILIVYLIDRFEDLTEFEFQVWEACTANVYI